MNGCYLKSVVWIRSSWAQSGTVFDCFNASPFFCFLSKPRNHWLFFLFLFVCTKNISTNCLFLLILLLLLRFSMKLSVQFDGSQTLCAVYRVLSNALPPNKEDTAEPWLYFFPSTWRRYFYCLFVCFLPDMHSYSGNHQLSKVGRSPPALGIWSSEQHRD